MIVSEESRRARGVFEIFTPRKSQESGPPSYLTLDLNLWFGGRDPMLRGPLNTLI